MKKILFVLFALMVSQPAMAQWVEMGGDSSARRYYDPSRIESYSGIYQSIWTLEDISTTQSPKGIKKPFRSIVFRWNVDCSTKEIRVIGAFFYSENMGKGELVDSSSRQRSFESSPPNSIGEKIANLACKK
jgi:hypothetical protein